MTAPPFPPAAPPAGWADLAFFRDTWPEIAARLNGRDWLPGPERVFAALAMTPPGAVRVVILGQDPYPTPGHANGLAFSVTPQTPLPRSLKNIYAEMPFLDFFLLGNTEALLFINNKQPIALGDKIYPPFFRLRMINAYSTYRFG